MEISEFAKTFFDVMNQINPGLKDTLSVGTSIVTMTSGVFNVIQKGAHLFTIAIGRKKEQKQDEKKPRVKKKKLPGGLEISTHQAIAEKAHIAIVVEISRQAVQNVADFLEQNDIDANLVIISNVSGPADHVKGLSEDDPQEWLEIVQEFYQASSIIKRSMGAAHTHIFLASPVALAFGLGAVWGTVDDATVYHWDGQQYKALMPVNRNLRFALKKEQETGKE
jgi:hypothetical protein